MADGEGSGPGFRSSPPFSDRRPFRMTLMPPKASVQDAPSDAGSAPLHICHVVTGFGGGVYTSVRQIASRQAEDGHRVTVVRDFRGPYPRPGLEDFHPGIRFFEWHVPREISPAKDAAAFLKLFRILGRERPDILHLHCAKAGFLGRTAAVLFRMPAVYSPHGLPFYRADVSPWHRRFYFALEWLLARSGATVVACSGRELEGVQRLTDRRVLIANGIDLADMDRMAAAAHRNRKDGPFTIASAGLVNHARNPELVSRLALRSPEGWRWIWIGDGELRSVLAGHPRIEMSGWLPRDRAVATLASAHVLLHPSRWEGMPLVVLEAMALGLPVVASNIVGNADAVEHGRTGFLIDTEDGYLAALGRLADDPALRRRLGEAGRRRVEALFSIDALAPTWLALYRAEIARVRRR